MLWAVVVLLLILVSVVSIRHDPRKLRNGVYLLVAFCAVALTVVVATLASVDEDGDPLPLAWGLLTLLVIGLLSAVVLGVFNVLNGFTMIRKEGRRPANLLSLVFGVGVLGYCALIIVVWVSDVRQSGAALDLFLLLVALGLPLMHLALLFGAFVGYGLLYGWAVRRWGRPVDVVVVLGAGLSGDRVTPLLAGRLDRGREVLEAGRRRGRETHLICSGGQGADEVVPEAVAMRNHLVEAGVDPDLIWLEDRSTTTEENLRLSAEVAQARGVADCRFAVVSNNYHAFRAALLMRKVGLAGYAVGSRTASYFWPSAILREYAAVLRDHRIVNGAILAVLCLPMLGLVVRLMA